MAAPAIPLPPGAKLVEPAMDLPPGARLVSGSESAPAPAAAPKPSPIGVAKNAASAVGTAATTPFSQALSNTVGDGRHVPSMVERYDYGMNAPGGVKDLATRAIDTVAGRGTARDIVRDVPALKWIGGAADATMRAGLGLMDFGQTPLGMALPAASKMLPPAVSAGVGAGFATEMAPGTAEAAREAWRDPNATTVPRAVAAGVVNALPMLHGRGGPRPVTRVAPEQYEAMRSPEPRAPGPPAVNVVWNGDPALRRGPAGPPVVRARPVADVDRVEGMTPPGRAEQSAGALERKMRYEDLLQADEPQTVYPRGGQPYGEGREAPPVNRDERRGSAGVPETGAEEERGPSVQAPEPPVVEAPTVEAPRPKMWPPPVDLKPKPVPVEATPEALGKVQEIDQQLKPPVAEPPKSAEQSAGVFEKAGSTYTELFDRLDRASKEASERLKAKGIYDGANLGMGASFDLATLKDISLTIAGDVARGVMSAAELVKRYGEAIGPHAEKLIAMAKEHVREVAPGFYSQLERTIDEKMPERASAEQVRAIVRNPQHGVSANEVADTGLEEWLGKSQGPVGKSDALGYVTGKRPVIKEEMKGEFALPQALRARYAEAGAEFTRLQNERLDAPAYTPRSSREAALERELIEIERQGGTKTKYADQPKLNTPGGEEHRELLTKLPENPGGDFRQGHWDDSSVVAHQRFHDRTGANGEKIMHVDEFQSDWHQQGRKKGYRGASQPGGLSDEAFLDRYFKPERFKANTAYVVKVDTGEHEGLYDGGEPVTGYHPTVEAARTEALAWVRENRFDRPGADGKAPDAPFSKDWQELALKRALKHAAENGYDKLTWTTGETQNARYNLSKEIESVSYEPASSRLMAHAVKGPRILDATVKPEGIAEYIGEAAAKRLLAAPFERRMTGSGNAQVQSIRGEGLKLGGEGMKGFYDQILPTFANKYLKKWGGRVVREDIPGEYADIGEVVETHSIAITPEIRAGIMEGQALHGSGRPGYLERRGAEAAKRLAAKGIGEPAKQLGVGAPEPMPEPSLGGFLRGEEGVQPNAKDLSDAWLAFRREITDKFAAVDDLARKARVPLTDEESPYVGARLAGGAVAGKALNRVENHLGRVLRKANKEKLLDVLGKYALFERYEELNDRGITKFPNGQTIHQIRTDRAALEATLGPANVSAVKNLTARLRGYSNRILREAWEGGLLTDGGYREILAKNQKYVPLQRLAYLEKQIADGREFDSGALSIRSQDLVNSLSKEGSTKEVVDPIEAMIRNTYRAMSAIERNRVATQVADLSSRPEFAGVIEKMKPGHALPAGMESISLLRKGVREDYAVPREVGRALKNLDSKQVDIVTQAAGAMSSITRAGATSLNVGFIASNIIRDAQTATAVSRVGFTPVDWFKGLGQAMKVKAGIRSKVYDRYLESGAAMSGYFAGSQSLPGTVSRLTEGTGKKALRQIAPWNLVRNLGELTELIPRLGVFMKSEEQGLSRASTGFNSRNATVDFQKSGNTVRAINMWVPFLNARMQGNILLFDAMRPGQVPKRLAGPAVSGTINLVKKGTTAGGAVEFGPKSVASWNAMKLGALVGIPVVATYMYNHRSKETAAVYENIKDYEKRGNFVLVMGTEMDDEGRYTQVVKIPKGDVKAFSNPVENLLDHLKANDPKALAQLAVETVSDISPVDFENEGKLDWFTALASLTPPLAKAWAEGGTNKNWYTGRDIVPEYKYDTEMRKMSPEEQYTDRTSNAAKAIGKVTGFAPLKVDNFMGTMAGGLGKQVMAATGSGKKEAGPAAFGESVSRRYVGAQGGADDKDRKVWGEVQRKNADEVGIRGRDAEAMVNKLMAMKVTERAAFVRDAIAKGTMDEKMATALTHVIQGRALGLTPMERTLKQGSLDERADFIARQLTGAKTAEEKRAIFGRYVEKKILTNEVAGRISKILMSQPAPGSGPPPVRVQ